MIDCSVAVAAAAVAVAAKNCPIVSLPDLDNVIYSSRHERTSDAVAIEDTEDERIGMKSLFFFFFCFYIYMFR